MHHITDRKTCIAYRLAEWVCLRQHPVERLATVRLWAEVNHIELTEDEAEYALMHWLDFVIEG